MEYNACAGAENKFRIDLTCNVHVCVCVCVCVCRDMLNVFHLYACVQVNCT